MGSENAPVLCLDQLIAMKKAAARDKDLLDVEFLQQIANVKANE